MSVSPRAIAAPPRSGHSCWRRATGRPVLKKSSPPVLRRRPACKSATSILKVNGKEVADSPELIETISSYQPGEQVELLIKRGNQELTKSAMLGSKAEIFDMEDDRAEFQNSLGGQLSRAARMVFDPSFSTIRCSSPTNAAGQSSISTARPWASTSPVPAASKAMPCLPASCARQ